MKKSELEEFPEEINVEGKESQQPHQQSYFRKVLVISSGILLVLLIISYVFVSFPIDKIIAGKLASDLLQENILSAGNLTVIFENGTDQRLQALYHEEQKVEFSACLGGTKEGNMYIITSLYQPKMFQQSFNHVSFEPCSAETLLILHTHPYKSCIASATDLNTLRKTQERNPDTLMIVMCEPRRLSVYS